MFFSNYKSFYLDDGTFDLKTCRYAGHTVRDVIGEILLFLIFGTFYAWGIYNLIDFVKYIGTQYQYLVDTYGALIQATGIAELIIG